jgi:hypothetical protein
MSPGTVPPPNRRKIKYDMFQAPPPNGSEFLRATLRGLLSRHFCRSVRGLSGNTVPHRLNGGLSRAFFLSEQYAEVTLCGRCRSVMPDRPLRRVSARQLSRKGTRQETCEPFSMSNGDRTLLSRRKSGGKEASGFSVTPCFAPCRILYCLRCALGDAGAASFFRSLRNGRYAAPP